MSGRTTFLAQLRTALLLRQHHRCFWCGHPVTLDTAFDSSATLDHLVPLSSGGRTNMTNLVVACARCNNIRGTTPYIRFFALSRLHPLPPPSTYSRGRWHETQPTSIPAITRIRKGAKS
jgi:5-methylcytosine-specific restriction endonuclease McrA